MHEAFESTPIMTKLPLQIESITCHDNTLLVGTKQGHLLVYRVSNTKPDVNLERSLKSFAKKPIQQVEAIPECHVLISLSDGVISVHDLGVYSLMTTLDKARGAMLFAVSVEVSQSLTEGEQPVLRLCTVNRRKVQLFYWKNRDFHSLTSDLNLPDAPKVVTWSKDSLFIGFKREYFHIKVTSGTTKELFSTGKLPEPVITPLEDNKQLVLGVDDKSIFVSLEGDPTQRYALHWNEPPSAVVHLTPYLLGVLPGCIEVRTIEPKLLIQTMELSKAKFVCKHKNTLYVATTSSVWRISPRPLQLQIDQLLKERQFELAHILAKQTEGTELPAQQQGRLQNIETLHAFSLFCKGQFKESLAIFTDLHTDASHVIGLFPNLLPDEFRSKIKYPDKPPVFEGAELENGYMALIEYLTDKRHKLQAKDGEFNPTPIVENGYTIAKRKHLSQIIDTTLLKCYLQTNDALVSSLLRLKDNQCHVEESERALKKHQKYLELVILYEKKELHHKALELLLRHSQRQGSPLRGHERLVTYLQHLGPKHIDLILDYSSAVLKASEDDGFKVFTEDVAEVEALPRERVVTYLEQEAPQLVIPYLEHIIDVWRDTTPDFHNRLVNAYRERVMEFLADYLNSLPEGQAPAEAGREPGELGTWRSRLLTFLHQSEHYAAERALPFFPLDSLYDERAVLLGRLGRHEQALTIYMHVLQSLDKAERHCNTYYDVSKQNTADVYLHLLRLCLVAPAPLPGLPSDRAALGFGVVNELLEKYATKVDVPKVLGMLPDAAAVQPLLTFLEQVLEARSSRRRDCQLLKSLAAAQHLQRQEQLMQQHSVRFIVTESQLCDSCRRRIGNSAFARYPNGRIVHYFCFQQNEPGEER